MARIPVKQVLKKYVGDPLASVGQKTQSLGEETSAKVFGGEAPDDTITKLDSGDLLIKSLDQDEVEALNDIIRNQGYKGPDLDFGLDMDRLGSIFDSDNQVQSLGGVMTRLAAQNKELFLEMKRGKKSMADLLVLAQQAGIETHMFKFLKLNPGGILPPEDVMGGILAGIRLTHEVNYGADLILKALDDTSEAGIERLNDLYKKQGRLLAIQTNLMAKVSGVVSEYGRGMSVVRHMKNLQDFDLKTYTEELLGTMQGWDARNIDFAVMDATGRADVKLKMLQILHMPNPSKAKFANKLFLAKTYDVAMEIYINALLTNPVSHSVNIAGNAAFQFQTLIERGVAGVIGEIRTSKLMPSRYRGKDTDRVYLGEMQSEAHGLSMAQKDAVGLMFRTFITGESGTLSSKIELRNMTAIGKENNLGKILENAGNGDFNSMFFDIMGVATRMPGRFLSTEDEYFKVVTMRRVLYREAHRRATTDYKLALKAGKTKEEAKSIFENTYVTIMHDTPNDVETLMRLEAKEMTFQSDLTGAMGVAGKLANHPILKPVVPFFKTPANIVQNVWDRSFNGYPIIEALRKGQGSGRAFDEAMAKLVTGWGAMTVMYNLASGVYGDDLIITGKGPSDRKARKIMSDKGIQPYSIGFKQEDGSYKTFTFSRMDPLSGLLAMSADMAYYMRDSDMTGDPNFGMAMMNAATLSAGSYAITQPMLQGLSEIIDAVGNVNAGEEKVMESIIKFTSRKAADVTMSITGSAQGRMTFGMGAYVAETFDIPFIGATSFSAAMERYNNPTSSNTMPPDQYIFGTHATELNPMFRGFYEAVQSAKSRHPTYSDSLPPALDFWGKPRQPSEGVFEEFFNPIRTTQGAKLTQLDQELLRLSERDAGTFSPHKRNINGVKLAASEYNYYISLINQFDDEDRHSTDPNYDESTNLLNVLNGTVNPLSDLSEAYYDPEIAMDNEAKYNILSAEVAQRRRAARKRLIEDTPRLFNIFNAEQ